MKFPTRLSALGAALLLSACSGLDLATIVDTSASDEEPTEVLLPPNPEPGACYGREVVPAVVETATRHITTRAATFDTAGKQVTPAAYRTETTQKIVTDREEIWFKVPCSKDKFANFNESVQRALKARGYYGGRITGVMDSRTRRAIQRFQLTMGLDSGTLSLEAARKLGLVAVPRSEMPSDTVSG